jgi:hypothetical protein
LVRLYGQILLYLARERRISTSKKLVSVRAMTLYGLGADLSLVRVGLSAFRDKSKFETIINKISQAFDDVNIKTSLQLSFVVKVL